MDQKKKRDQRRRGKKRRLTKRLLFCKRTDTECKKTCEDTETFEDCELAILRKAIDDAETKHNPPIDTHNPEIQRMLKIVEYFISSKQLVCYGGTAINNILPVEDQFYDLNKEIPDYDFYSSDALNDAKELADIYFAAGFKDVEAKSGVHFGTYKVFVNFIPMADITQIDTVIFDQLKKHAIQRGGIRYAPPDFLRMGMYLELSRPAGDVSRWEKVQKRLTLLNNRYPLQALPYANKLPDDFSVLNPPLSLSLSSPLSSHSLSHVNIGKICFDAIAKHDVVFFGSLAMCLYSSYLTSSSSYNHKQMVKQVMNKCKFMILSNTPELCVDAVKTRLKEKDVMLPVEVIQHDAIGELVSRHYEIRVGEQTRMVIFEPETACHSYNMTTTIDSPIKVASIDTCLCFYLAFLFSGRKEMFCEERIRSLTHMLFTIQQINRLSQHGLLRRFSTDCYGKQKSLVDMREEKAQKFIELAGNKRSVAYQQWFLSYSPTRIKQTMNITRRRRRRRISKDDDDGQDKYEHNLRSFLQDFIALR